MNELSVDAALARLRAQIAPIPEVERVALGQCAGRVLATDVISAVDLPPFDNAAMDGYAVRCEDATNGASLRVIGQALAGHAFEGAVAAGQTVRIMTGGVLPAGANAVVMREDTQAAGDTVRIARTAADGLNVRRRGEHVRRGEAVLHAGRRLRSQDVGLAASVGAAELDVVRRVRVALLSTGDELADPPTPLAEGAAYDGNRPLLAALVARAGATVIDLGIARDNERDFARQLDAAVRERADLLLTTGGAAQGDADIVRQRAELEFVPVNVRPGRGVLFGRVGDRTLLLGLPGNAVAAYLLYQLVARPLLGWLAGARDESPLTLQLPLAVDTRGKPDRIEWLRARFVMHQGIRALEPLRDQGSAMLRTVSEAEALVAIPADGVRAGETVDAIPLAALD